MVQEGQSERIVITGLGVLCALGNSPEQVFGRMLAGLTGIKPLTRFNTENMQCSIAGELEADDLEKVVKDEATRPLDPCARYAIYAARQALENSGLRVKPLCFAGQEDGDKRGALHAVRADRVGLVLGTCNGGILSLEKQWNLDQLDIEHTAQYPFYQQGDDTAKALGLNGPAVTINTACAASGNAIGLAYDLLRWGYADVMLAGGSDPLSHSVFAGFNVLRALNPQPASPFGSRYGLNLGEGAAFVVLERLEHALARGAHIYGELCAYGLSNDAYHETAPHPEGKGLAKAVEMALKQGGVKPEQIGYINMHGTGTEANDKAEVAALKRVFGPKIPVPISSSKAYFGHNLGAAAAVELVTALYAIRQGYLPGTLHFDRPRPGCEEVDVIGPAMRLAQPEYILSNNAAFGGHNVSLLIRTGIHGQTLEEALRKSGSQALQPEKRWEADASPPVKTETGDRHWGANEVDSSGEESGRLAKQRVAIAGIGAVGHWGLSQGGVVGSLIDPPEGTKPGQASFSLKEYRKEYYERRMNGLTQYTIGAALAALEHAGLAEKERGAMGFIYGTARGSTESISRFLRSVFEKGPELASSIYFPHTVINSVAGTTAQKLNLNDFSSSLSTGGNDGLTAALYASGLIRQGTLSCCLIGAGDERSALSDSIDRAKGLTESQWVRTEGSVSLVLVNPDLLQKKKAEGICIGRPLAELRGFGTVFTAGLQDEEREAAICGAIKRALLEAALPLDCVDLVLFNSVGRGREWEWEESLMSRLIASGSSAVPILCLNDLAGYGESYSSMLHLAVAAELVASPKSWERIKAHKRLNHQQPEHVLVISSSVNGNYTAVMVSHL
jgi:3-oxoacyl-[acyl-carrier-protein] synthase II